MEHLFRALDHFSNDLTNKEVILFLDYDGTLTPIVKTPEIAVLSSEARDTLEKLSRNPKFRVAIISGRSLKDVKKLVGLKNIVYVGNHGLEIEGPAIGYKCFVPDNTRLIIREICEKLSNRLSDLKGVFTENKGLTLSVHYRLARPRDASAARKIAEEIVRPYIRKNKVKLNSGKKVVEIKPAGRHDKGKAVLWLLARPIFAREMKDFFPIYIGDDTTDEDGFKALEGRGLAVFVGRPKPSRARYYLKNARETISFLEKLLKLKRIANG
ncbi:MAG: trehalose-phosphatase [Candidatus Omnitrophica bacterium]|nr:trehalose-phosphatase [Candidatus Omnitrophota bacterium]